MIVADIGKPQRKIRVEPEPRRDPDRTDQPESEQPEQNPSPSR